MVKTYLTLHQQVVDIRLHCGLFLSAASVKIFAKYTSWASLDYPPEANPPFIKLMVPFFNKGRWRWRRKKPFLSSVGNIGHLFFEGHKFIQVASLKQHLYVLLQDMTVVSAMTIRPVIPTVLIHIIVHRDSALPWYVSHHYGAMVHFFQATEISLVRGVKVL